MKTALHRRGLAPAAILSTTTTIPSAIPTAGTARRRTLAALSAVSVAVLLASCATQPMGDSKGKPIFESFNQCMLANGVGAVAIGALANKLLGNKVVGVAAAAATLFVAWKNCGEAHQRVTVQDERGRDALLGDPRFRRASTVPVLTLDELEVAAPKAGEDITTRYRFAYTNPDATRKDIPARERFVYLAGYTDDQGAQQFKEVEFQRDFVIQQGQRRHEHAVPSDKSFDQFKPWKLRYQLEVDGQCLETEANFDINSPNPGHAGPARACTPQMQAAAGAKSMSANAAAQSPAAQNGAAQASEATLRVSLRLLDKPDGAPTGKSLAKGSAVRVLETSQVKLGSRMTQWVRVQPAGGAAGWLPAGDLQQP